MSRRSLLRISLVLACVALATAASHASAQPAPSPPTWNPEVAKHVSLLRAAYLPMTTWGARVEVGWQSGALSSEQHRDSGTFAWTKPLYLDWRFQSGRRVLSDGIDVADYDATKNEVLIRPNDDDWLLVLPSYFEPTVFTRTAFFREGKHVPGDATKFPLQAMTAKLLLLLSVDRANGQIYRAQATDGITDHWVHFVGAQVDPPLLPDQFVMRVPHGTKVFGVLPKFVTVDP